MEDNLDPIIQEEDLVKVEDVMPEMTEEIEEEDPVTEVVEIATADAVDGNYCNT